VKDTEHTCAEKFVLRPKEEVVDIDIGEGGAESFNNGRAGEVVFERINGTAAAAKGTR
jgi:hypothetical protein